MCLKAMEKIDKCKDKKHTSKVTNNPEDKTPFITCQIRQALASCMRLCSIGPGGICQRECSEYTYCPMNDGSFQVNRIVCSTR